jgi:hypothetical protein
MQLLGQHVLIRPHNIQHNDTQHNDTRHNDIQHNAIQHNYTQYYSSQHKGLNWDTQILQSSGIMLSVTFLTVILNVIIPTVEILDAVMLNVSVPGVVPMSVGAPLIHPVR